MVEDHENYKEVHFDEYCKTCKYKDLKEVKDPCNECLEHPMNLYTHKPVGWKEMDKSTKEVTNNERIRSSNS